MSGLWVLWVLTRYELPHFLLGALIALVVSWLILGKPSLLASLLGGIGGVSIDFDHFLNIISQGQIPWSLFHQPWVAVILLGGIITSGLGLYFTLVLRRYQ